jgi:hypothetical protein
VLLILLDIRNQFKITTVVGSALPYHWFCPLGRLIVPETSLEAVQAIILHSSSLGDLLKRCVHNLLSASLL